MHPNLFEFTIPLSHEPVRVTSFGATMLVAFLATTWLFAWQAGRDAFCARRVVWLAVCSYVAGIVGARWLFVLLYANGLDARLHWFSYWQPGLEFYGGADAASYRTATTSTAPRWRAEERPKDHRP